MLYIEVVLIVAIIALQIYSYVKNLLRIREFNNIFNNINSCSVVYEQGLLNGISGRGKATFNSIITTINKYLSHNTGAAIEFGLLKDTVDRYCDAVENDIQVRTPVPLYLGLMGTMLGVIIGLFDLTGANVIDDLMAGTSQNATNGITNLLKSVAMAMVASLCGIALTTWNSIRFKQAKLKEEEGKNNFLAWMQAELLPKLPTDTSQAIRMLVNNLNEFNQSFSSNTQSLGATLAKVNESYATQAEIVKAVQEMDVMRVAIANVSVLKELSQCTNKLEAFNEYLSAINGYTDAIHRFETLFHEEADRVKVLEEIRNFFNRHKEEIAKTTADADYSLKESLRTIRESTGESVKELNASYLTISENFKDLIRDEKETFTRFAEDMRQQFTQQLTQVPLIVEQVKEIARIPAHINLLLTRIEETNRAMQASIAQQTQTKLDGFSDDMQRMMSEQLDAVNELPAQIGDLVGRLEESKLLRRKKAPVPEEKRTTSTEGANDAAQTSPDAQGKEHISAWVWILTFLLPIVLFIFLYIIGRF